MPQSKEVKILIENAYQDDVLEAVNCEDCGKEILLWLNDRELDEKGCCGHKYFGRAKGYEVVTDAI